MSTEVDIDQYIPQVSSSLINLDDENIKGDLGLKDFILESVLADTIAIDFDDLKEGYVKRGDFVVPTSNLKTWRRGKVIMVGPNVSPKDVKVGDLVVFPSTKGLDAGEAWVRNPDGSVSEYKHVYFLSTNRIFGVVTNVNQPES